MTLDVGGDIFQSLYFHAVAKDGMQEPLKPAKSATS